jgi:hypothetical protein
METELRTLVCKILGKEIQTINPVLQEKYRGADWGNPLVFLMEEERFAKRIFFRKDLPRLREIVLEEDPVKRVLMFNDFWWIEVAQVNYFTMMDVVDY